MSNPGHKPSVAYWHLWVDANGTSHQQLCHLTDYELKGVGLAEPQWNDRQGTHPSTVVFTVQPVGWVGDWHENPAPQWIVVLSGRWWIESMDGTRIEQGAGRILIWRGSRLHRDKRQEGPPIWHHWRRARGFDDGAIAYHPFSPTLPCWIACNARLRDFRR